ncbi:MAG: dihydrodipicolinate synthase family protein [Amphiplicatus sp.]
MAQVLKGVLAPVITPFDADLRPNAEAWIAHCRWLLSQDCGLAVFGTTSEGNSISTPEKCALLEAAAESGLETARMMPGVGACSIPETVELTKAAIEIGASGVLMLPPFYYKAATEDGLFAFFSEVIERVGDERLKIYLYHIPQVSGVPISLALAERLLKAYPITIAGAKDSSGDWPNTKAMIDMGDNFDVFAGSEIFLLETMRAGGVGCIGATTNITPAAIYDVYANWRAEDADDRQARITAFRKALDVFPMIPMLKAAIGLFNNDSDWFRVRPPLVALSEADQNLLRATLRRYEIWTPE